jgi:hypothetical protein
MNSDLKFEKLRDVEAECKDEDDDNVGGRMTTPDPDPKRTTDGEVPLQADGQSAVDSKKYKFGVFLILLQRMTL